MSASGSLPRTTLPVGLACFAVSVGWLALQVGSEAAAALGPRAALVAAELCLVAPALLALAPFGIPFRRGLALVRITPRAAVLTLLAGAALWACAIGLVSLQQALWPPPPGHAELFDKLYESMRPRGPLEALASFAAMALVPAACEEALFRGTLLPAFLTRFRAAEAVVLAAALFAFVHLAPTQDGGVTTYQMPQALLVGLALGALRVRSGSLLPGIVAHTLYNATTFALAMAAPSAFELGPFQSLGMLLGGGTVLALALNRFPREPAEPPSLLDSIP
jgi:membrane protease YdiL (CAAX protease family)